jgi:hypothetical protein
MFGECNSELSRPNRPKRDISRQKILARPSDPARIFVSCASLRKEKPARFEVTKIGIWVQEQLQK